MHHVYRLLSALLLATSAAHAQPGYEVSLVFNPQPNQDSNPGELTVYDGRLFFTSWHPAVEGELWFYDAVTGEVGVAAVVRPGSGSATLRELRVYDGRLFFTAFLPASGNELWAYDAATGEVALVADIWPGPGRSYPENLTVYNGRLFFSAIDEATGRELWAYDAATGITAQVVDLDPGPGDAFSPAHITSTMVVYDHRLFFAADDGAIGDDLWAYDAATDEAALIRAGAPELLIVYDDRLYFLTTPGLFAYDSGTDEVTPVASFGGGAVSSESGGIAVYDGRLFFLADDGVIGHELWVHDAATGETSLAADVWPGWRDGLPLYLTVYDGRLYFSAHDDRLFENYDRELWVYDAATGEASQVADIYPGVKGSSPRFLTAYDDRLYFNARDPLSNYELWALGPVSTPATEPETPSAFALTEASPNPFTSATALRLTLPHLTEVTAEAFDLLGRRVAVLHDGPMAAGEQALRWEAGGLPAGIYVVRVRTGDGHVEARQVTLVR